MFDLSVIVNDRKNMLSTNRFVFFSLLVLDLHACRLYYTRVARMNKFYFLISLV